MTTAMATASWKLTLEFTSDDGEGGPSTLTLGTTGEWKIDDPSAVNECVAVNMASVMRMLIASDELVRDSGMEGSVEAFGR